MALFFLLLGAGVFEASAVRSQEPRFGDSTWVAPQADSIAGASGIDTPGPRVAARDHERGWETALRAPFRLVFLPFRLLARGLEFGVSKFGGGFVEPKAPKPTYGPRFGVRFEINDVATGLQDVGVGPAVAWAPQPDLKIRASAVASIRDRRHVLLRSVYRDHQPTSLFLDGDYDFRPDRSFFGIGNDTEKEDRAFYRLEDTRLDGSIRI
ncbi:MAG TPA: hypothetical protein VF720_12305, partial [Candidatus Eisenbacteria bacterium]